MKSRSETRPGQGYQARPRFPGQIVLQVSYQVGKHLVLWFEPYSLQVRDGLWGATSGADPRRGGYSVLASVTRAESRALPSATLSWTESRERFPVGCMVLPLPLLGAVRNTSADGG